MIPLVSPLLGNDEKRILNEIIDSRIIASGAYVDRFEKESAAFSGSRFAVATSNGTTALHAALLACGIRPGDKVLTTPFSFIATANSILFCGAKPVFADIDPATYNLSPEAAEKALRKHRNIKAIIVVHLYGQPADMGAFLRLKKKYRLALIEDCAQAHGARYKGRCVGSFGDAAAFSYYATKNITTGEGGIILTSAPRVDRLARQLINHGRDGQSTHTILGYNFRLTNLAAGIGLVQLKKLGRWNEARRKNGAFLTSRLEGLDFLETPFVPSFSEPVFHQYTVRVDAGLRPEFMKYLSENGIGCGIYYPTAIYRQPLYQGLGYAAGLCPEAERAAREVVSLPVHPALTRKDLETIAGTISRFKKR
ncbi:MAG: DegT/DnrJ/EryC1/StrS family aminotransferase [Endomicrobiales bacterium]